MDVQTIERRQGWRVAGRVGKTVELAIGVAIGMGVILGALALLNMVVRIRTLDSGMQLLIFGGVALVAPGCVRAGISLVHSFWRWVRMRRFLRSRRYAELLEPARELVEAAEWVFGDRHEETTARRHALCALLYQVGEIDEARELAERNLRYRLEELGPHHPDTAASRDMAEMFRAAGP